MRIALAVLCIGAVVFLLRVLVALVGEWTNLPYHKAEFYFARFNPSRRWGEVVVMPPAAQKREYPNRSDERIAL